LKRSSSSARASALARLRGNSESIVVRHIVGLPPIMTMAWRAWRPLPPPGVLRSCPSRTGRSLPACSFKARQPSDTPPICGPDPGSSISFVTGSEYRITQAISAACCTRWASVPTSPNDGPGNETRTAGAGSSDRSITSARTSRGGMWRNGKIGSWRWSRSARGSGLTTATMRRRSGCVSGFATTGSPNTAHQFLGELKCLGIASTPSYVGEPQRSGIM